MFKDKISKELVRERMAYPYEIKVRMTERRLSEFITYYGGKRRSRFYKRRV